MPDYDYLEFPQRPLSRRFPEWAIGWDLRSRYSDDGVEMIRRLLDALQSSPVGTWNSEPAVQELKRGMPSIPLPHTCPMWTSSASCARASSFRQT